MKLHHATSKWQLLTVVCCAFSISFIAPVYTLITGLSRNDEEDEVPLVNPSKNIKASTHRYGSFTDHALLNPSLKRDLELALKDTAVFSGSFASSQSYDDAPNPFLRIDGFGTLGLPLSEAEAQRLIGVCKQAPFGKGEETVVDKSVRDTWEVDASKVPSLMLSCAEFFD